LSGESALPPLEERDGSRAHADAADKEDWVAVESADGHAWWCPPEVAYLIAPGMSWNALEAILRPALAARAAAAAVAELKGGTKGAALSTQAFVRALAAYLDADEDLDESWAGETLAKKVEAFALKREIVGAHLIKPRHHAIRQLAGCALDGLRQTRQRDRK
jgi:hypothetical protein